MSFWVDLRANVPLYGQQSCNWCGAASAQMIMNGYPNPANRILHSQNSIWNTIQANNSTDPTDLAQNWATDPEGLRDCLMIMNPPPGGGWSIFSDASRSKVLFDILYWMNHNSYPVATLISGGGHWVVIVGFETDIQPVAGSSPNLVHILVYDPEPHNVGTSSTVDAAVWSANQWANPVLYAGSWQNKYVAVIEPPVATGEVRIEKLTRVGERTITPKEAVASARRSIRELKLAKKAPYAILRMKGIKYHEPILVREEIKPILKKETAVPYYYIVPFGFEKETDEGNVRLVRVCVIVNAFTGKFEEITAFGKPVKYLSQKEAIRIAAKAMDLNRSQIEEVKATMMFLPSDITHIRVYPFWKIAIKDRTIYIDQLGTIYTTIKPAVPGD